MAVWTEVQFYFVYTVGRDTSMYQKIDYIMYTNSRLGLLLFRDFSFSFPLKGRPPTAS
jgi:hypothetical protein